MDVKGNKKNWIRRLTLVLAAFVVTWIPLSDFYIGKTVAFLDWIRRPPGVNSVALNHIDGCRAGDLREVVSRYLDSAKQYTYRDGAEALRICATETIQSRAASMASAIERAFPGCIRYSDYNDTFVMIANAKAVCRVISGDSVRYICDGSRAGARGPAVGFSQKGSLPICSSPTGF